MNITDKQRIVVSNTINALKAMVSMNECLPVHFSKEQEACRQRILSKCREDLKTAEIELKEFKS